MTKFGKNIVNIHFHSDIHCTYCFVYSLYTPLGRKRGDAVDQYGEAIIALNVAANAFLLAVSGKMSRAPVKKRSVLAAGAAGALPLLAWMLTGWSSVFFQLMIITTPIGMISMAFWSVSVKKKFSITVTFYLMAFLTGGIIQSLIETVLFAENKRPLLMFCLLLGAGTLTVFAVERRLSTMKQQRREQAQTAELSFQIDDFTWCGTGLVDTGNALYDPIKKRPVHICYSREAPSLDDIMNCPESWRKRLVLIPSRSIHGDQMIAAFRTDHMTVTLNGQKQEKTAHLVAFTKTPLSSEESFCCLIHPHMLTETGER